MTALPNTALSQRPETEPHIKSALFALTFAVISLVEALNAWAAESPKVWVLQISLDSPDLVPPAVQWALLDHDPVPEYKNRIAKSRAFNAKRLSEAKSESRMRIERGAQMSVAWDRSFRSVTGDQVHLLTSAPGVTQALSSDEGEGPRWIVTKTVSIHGEPVCWCIPIETQLGANLDIKLKEKNRFDLLGVYESAMREGSPAPKPALP